MISANRTRLVRKLNVPLPVISPSVVLADVTQSLRSKFHLMIKSRWLCMLRSALIIVGSHLRSFLIVRWRPRVALVRSFFFSRSTATLYALGCLMWWFGGLIRLNLFMVCIVALRLVLRLAQQNNIPRMCWIANSEFASADLASMCTWNTLFTWWGSFISMEIR